MIDHAKFFMQVPSSPSTACRRCSAAAATGALLTAFILDGEFARDAA